MSLFFSLHLNIIDIFQSLSSNSNSTIFLNNLLSSESYDSHFLIVYTNKYYLKYCSFFSLERIIETFKKWKYPSREAR